MVKAIFLAFLFCIFLLFLSSSFLFNVKEKKIEIKQTGWNEDHTIFIDSKNREYEVVCLDGISYWRDSSILAPRYRKALGMRAELSECKN